MKAHTIIATSALAMLMAAQVFAASPSNVFLSGKVFKGDEVITTFAAPILLGSTLPVSDQVTNGAGTVDAVKLALTPKVSEGHTTTVLVSAEWNELNGPAKGARAAGTFNDKVEVAQGETKEIPFGNCGRIDGKLVGCSHKLVLSASAQ